MLTESFYSTAMPWVGGPLYSLKSNWFELSPHFCYNLTILQPISKFLILLFLSLNALAYTYFHQIYTVYLFLAFHWALVCILSCITVKNSFLLVNF